MVKSNWVHIGKREEKSIQRAVKTNWAETPADILVDISKRLPTLQEFLTFNRVCQKWRSSVATGNILIPQPSLFKSSLQANSCKKEEEQEEEVFLGFSQGGIFEQELYKCIGYKGNWIVTVNMEGKIHILNPLSDVRFDLPSQAALGDLFPRSKSKKTQLCKIHLHKVVVSSTPDTDEEKSSCAAVALHHNCRFLCVSRIGEQAWTAIHGIQNVEDVIFFKENFYAFNRGPDRLFQVDIHSNPNPEAIRCIANTSCTSYYWHDTFLAEWSGKLLLVGRRQRSWFDVYDLDFTSGRWSRGCELNFTGRNWELKFTGRNWDWLHNVELRSLTREIESGFLSRSKLH